MHPLPIPKALSPGKGLCLPGSSLLQHQPCLPGGRPLTWPAPAPPAAPALASARLPLPGPGHVRAQPLPQTQLSGPTCSGYVCSLGFRRKTEGNTPGALDSGTCSFLCLHSAALSQMENTPTTWVIFTVAPIKALRRGRCC
uniref:Uncharacterized protein n=1 Tax=Pipistrellus kuhlii TaxID=59472 RepID=A0A7J7VME3_PIPKU|nr:hypothetical protein mPipKuh1_008393 [Pipistrellus kuhlii]